MTRTYETCGKQFSSRARADKYARNIANASGVKVPVYETTGTPSTLDLQPGDILSGIEAEYVAQLNHLWDMLSDTIEGGRLTEADIPDDYQALVRQMVKLGNLQYKALKENERGL